MADAAFNSTHGNAEDPRLAPNTEQQPQSLLNIFANAAQNSQSFFSPGTGTSLFQSPPDITAVNFTNGLPKQPGNAEHSVFKFSNFSFAQPNKEQPQSGINFQSELDKLKTSPDTNVFGFCSTSELNASREAEAQKHDSSALHKQDSNSSELQHAVRISAQPDDTLHGAEPAKKKSKFSASTDQHTKGPRVARTEPDEQNANSSVLQNSANDSVHNSSRRASTPRVQSTSSERSAAQNSALEAFVASVHDKKGSYKLADALSSLNAALCEMLTTEEKTAVQQKHQKTCTHLQNCLTANASVESLLKDFSWARKI